MFETLASILCQPWRIGLSLCRQSLISVCPWRPQQEVKSIWRPSQETNRPDQADSRMIKRRDRPLFNLLLLMLLSRKCVSHVGEKKVFGRGMVCHSHHAPKPLRIAALLFGHISSHSEEENTKQAHFHLSAWPIVMCQRKVILDD